MNDEIEPAPDIGITVWYGAPAAMPTPRQNHGVLTFRQDPDGGRWTLHYVKDSEARRYIIDVGLEMADHAYTDAYAWLDMESW